MRIPKDLLCVWPQESAGNNSCHAWEIPDRASCLQRVSGQGTRGEDPRREEGEDAKAWWLIQNTEMEENLWNKLVSHLTPLRVNNGKQDNNYYLVVYPTLWMRYAYAHISMRQGLGGSGWHTEILCFFRHFVFFFSPAHIDLQKKTNEKHRKNTLRPNLSICTHTHTHTHTHKKKKKKKKKKTRLKIAHQISKLLFSPTVMPWGFLQFPSPSSMM